MDASQKSKLQYIALGSAACAGVAISLACLRQHGSAKKAHHDDKQPSHAEHKARESDVAKPSAAKATPVSQASPSVCFEGDDRFDQLEAWATPLRKRDAVELPTLLIWTERVLKEQPEHNSVLACLKALTHVVGGNQEAERVSAIAVKAGSRHPEQALELLNALFKDRRQRGGYVAETIVVEFVLDTLAKSLQGGVSRSVYQRACRLLDWLVLDAENRQEVASRGGLEILLKVMEKCHDDGGVMLEGCASLRSVAAEPSLDVDRCYAVLISCLQTFPENGQMIWRALSALHALGTPAKDEKLLIAELACAAASKHPRFDQVIEWTAKVLCQLASDSDMVVRTWLTDPSRKSWLEKFQEAPLGLRQASKEAEVSVRQLSRLCSK